MIEKAEVDPSTIDADETVAFLPTFAVMHEGAWQVPIEAWVYEPEEGDLGREALLEALGEALEHHEGAPDEDVIAESLRPFVVDNERGQWVAMRRGGYAVRLGPTDSKGRVSGTLKLPPGDPAARGEGDPPWVELEVVLHEGDARRFSAWSQLLDDDGISVISDIDDTIRISEVHDRTKLLENTFLRPYREVPGMAQAYRRWADRGVAFHYVSASPLPLVHALGAFVTKAGFPRGSLSLRPFRWKDGTALELLDSSEGYKRDVIASIIESFERRSFVLVGDTGERDPEIYAEIAKRYPGRVRAIFLRDPLPGGTAGVQARLHALFDGLPSSLYQLIVDGGGLPPAP